MTEKSEFKIFMRNAIKYLTFGFRMYENGVCDQPIKGDFKLVDSREMYGYTKKEASDLLGLSVRQFDRKQFFAFEHRDYTIFLYFCGVFVLRMFQWESITT